MQQTVIARTSIHALYFPTGIKIHRINWVKSRSWWTPFYWCCSELPQQSNFNYIHTHNHTFVETRRGFVNFYRANNLLAGLLNSGNTRAGGGIKSPVLYIWGVEDGALSLEVAEASASISELVRLELVQSASHWVQQDRPDEVNRLMREFLD